MWKVKAKVFPVVAGAVSAVIPKVAPADSRDNTCVYRVDGSQPFQTHGPT